MFRYKCHYYNVTGIHSDAVKPDFLQHAQEAEQHAELLAKRIVELNGSPNFNPEGLAQRSRSEFSSHNSDIISMIRADLVAERIAAESIQSVLGGSDPMIKRRAN